MPNYGDPESPRRGSWWRVFEDVCTAAEALQVGPTPYFFVSEAGFMHEPRAGNIGSRLAAGNWPTKLRDRAKAVAEAVGISWSAGKFSTITNARSYAAQLRDEALFDMVADVEADDDEAPIVPDRIGPHRVVVEAKGASKVAVLQRTPGGWIPLGHSARLFGRRDRATVITRTQGKAGAPLLVPPRLKVRITWKDGRSQVILTSPITDDVSLAFADPRAPGFESSTGIDQLLYELDGGPQLEPAPSTITPVDHDDVDQLLDELEEEGHGGLILGGTVAAAVATAAVIAWRRRRQRAG